MANETGQEMEQLTKDIWELSAKTADLLRRIKDAADEVNHKDTIKVKN